MEEEGAKYKFIKQKDVESIKKIYGKQVSIPAAPFIN